MGNPTEIEPSISAIPVCLSCGGNNHQEFVIHPDRGVEEGFFIALTHLEPSAFEAQLVDHHRRVHGDEPAEYLVTYKRTAPQDPIRIQTLSFDKGTWAYGDIEEFPLSKFQAAIAADSEEHASVSAPDEFLKLITQQNIVFDLYPSRQQPKVLAQNSIGSLYDIYQRFSSKHGSDFTRQEQRQIPSDGTLYQCNPPIIKSAPYYPRRNLSCE